MRSLTSEIIRSVLIILALAVLAGVVYAATYARVPGNGGSQQVSASPLTPGCRLVTNNNSLDLFVPTNSQAEWNAFLSATIPNVTVSTVYGFGSTQTVCSTLGNTFPYSPTIGSCAGPSDVGGYKVVGQTISQSCATDPSNPSTWRPLYQYQQCNLICG